MCFFDVPDMFTGTTRHGDLFLGCPVIAWDDLRMSDCTSCDQVLRRKKQTHERRLLVQERTRPPKDFHSSAIAHGGRGRSPRDWMRKEKTVERVTGGDSGIGS